MSSGKYTIFCRIFKIDALHILFCQSMPKITNIFDTFPHLSTLFHMVLHHRASILLFYKFFNNILILYYVYILLYPYLPCFLIFWFFFWLFYWQYLIIMIELSCKIHRACGCPKQRLHYLFDYWDRRLLHPKSLFVRTKMRDSFPEGKDAPHRGGIAYPWVAFWKISGVILYSL